MQTIKTPSFQTNAPLFLIAGPCAVESRELLFEVAGKLCEICEARNIPLIFKSSYDKANRSAGDSPRGLGLDEGLTALAEVRREFSLPILTDVHLPQQAVAVAGVADVLQIPAFLCRQTDLIEACARTGRVVIIKKGQFAAPSDMAFAAEKARAAGAADVLLCERGTFFGYHDLVVDMRALLQLRDCGCPVVFDATHAAQKPGGGRQSGGDREMVAPLARAAVAVGINGLFVETHPNPEQAISDSKTQIPLQDMEKLLDTVWAFNALHSLR